MSDLPSDTLNLKARLKEAAQRQRASQAKRPELTEDKQVFGLFDRPKKIQNSNNDQTYNDIVRVLGPFDTIQPYVQTLNQTPQHVVGVVDQPPTPQIAVGKTFNYSKVDVPNGAVKKHSSDRVYHDRKHSVVKSDQDASDSKAEFRGSESKPGYKPKGSSSSSSNEPKAGHDSRISISGGDKGRPESTASVHAIHTSPVKSSAHTLTKDLNGKRDHPSPGAKSRPPAKPPSTTTPPLKEITPSITSSSLAESQQGHKGSSRHHLSSTPLKETPPPNGFVKRLGKDETKTRLPKLTIPSENKDVVQGGEDLYNIFREMIDIQPPLTGINTPQNKLEETFPFPAKYQNKDGKDTNLSKEKSNQEEEAEGTKPIVRKDSLSRDLVISSDDSETEQPPPECQTAGRKSPMNAVGKRRPSMSSNSDGSSNSSDSSSASDSDLSSSEDEEGKDDKPSPSASQPLPKSPAKESQNWGLRTFIDAVKQSSPEAPISLDTKTNNLKTTAPKKIDKTNENLLEELITTGISHHVPLKDIGSSISLPFDTEHLNDKEHSDNIFDVQFAKDVERQQNGVESMDESHHVNHSSSVESLSSPGALSSSSSASSRHAVKPASNKGHRRQSSAAEKVNKSLKNEKHYQSKSGASESRSRTMPSKHPTKNRSVLSSAEKKHKSSSVKTKAWISDSDSESDFVDVETVTPEGKKRASLLSNPTIDENKAAVLKKLFVSPRDDDSSSSSQGSVPSSAARAGEKAKVSERVNNKPKGHKKKERDEEVRKASSGDRRTDNDTDKHVDDIIQSLQTTKEFNPPVMLSPIPPFSSPNQYNPLLSSSSSLLSSTSSSSTSLSSSSQPPGLTCTDGAPSIIVQIKLLLLDCIPAKDNSQSASGIVSQNTDISAHSKVLTDGELDAKSLPSSHAKDSVSLKTSDSVVGHSRKSLVNKQNGDNHQSSDKVKSHSEISDSVLSEKQKCKSVDSPEKLKSRTKIAEANSSSSRPCFKFADGVEKVKIKSELTNDSTERNRSKYKVRDSELVDERNVNVKSESESRSPDKQGPATKSDESVSQVKDHTKLCEGDKLTARVSESELPSDVKSNSKVLNSSDSDNKTKHRSKSSSESSSVLEKKPQKRKPDLDCTENNKRHKSSSKSNKQTPSEETDRIENGVCVKEEENAKTNFLSKRRGSTSSSSSHHSNKSHSKKPKFDAKVKTKSPNPQRSTQEKETVVPHSQQNGDSHLPFFSYSKDHNHVKSKTVVSQPQSLHCGCYCPLENNLESADIYLARAKECKHQADKEKPVNICAYIESVLMFIQCGCAMERDQISEPSKIFTMYHDTLQLLKHICRVSRNGPETELPVKDKKLSVLILRIHALLCLKLFNLKRGEAIKFKKIIDHDHNKSATPKATAHAPSPHQGGWNNRSTGTPSPMSPTPSPAGSIGSVGSQGSCELSTTKLTNGSTGPNLMTSPGMVMVSQRIHSVTQQYINITTFAVQGHDLWAQADALASESKDFFADLDKDCRPLVLNSSVLELVHYVQHGLLRLKDT